MTTLELTPATPTPRHVSSGWLPSRHGAWALLAVPLVVGVAIAGWQPVHAPLTVAWIAGFLAFEAARGWLGVPRPERLGAPVVTYTVVTAVAGAAVLAQQPALALWLPVFVALVALSLGATRRGHAGGIVDGGSAVLAASLVLPVAYDAGAGGTFVDMHGPGMTVWVAFAVVLAYSFGTVLYVSTMLAARGPRLYAASIGFHAVALVLMRVVAMSTRVFHPVSLVLLFGALVMRAAVLPRRGATPTEVAVSEAGAALAVAAVLLLQTT